MANSRCELSSLQAEKLREFHTIPLDELMSYLPDALESASFTEITALNGHTLDGKLGIRAFTALKTKRPVGDEAVIFAYDSVNNWVSRLDVLDYEGYTPGDSLELPAKMTFFFDNKTDEYTGARDRLDHSVRGFEPTVLTLGKRCLGTLHSGLLYQGVDCSLVMPNSSLDAHSEPAPQSRPNGDSLHLKIA